ncbi:hypothetical protein NE237_010315 [Protea cynaroides]|uniref:DC1 domain-containing protein n=1 Tax=Protea cynaroides TaxID=273540 RepID=A0A9Q0KZJ6_9MAGN|nr:hypothetical protein NE237_010315 [Protea cynaroides]
MGQLNGQTSIHKPSIHHFSHPHPLELQVSNPQEEATNVIVSCSGCKLKASNTFYACKPCNYILHISCSQIAQQITHPADANHTLSLLPVPAYPEGFFNCDACGKSGNGFSYHCQDCNIDIHTLCARMPLSINHQSHHHSLTLTFSPPYQSKSFTCDVCRQVGSNHWLYRCNLCEFDAHLGCAITKPEKPVPAQKTVRPNMYNPNQVVNRNVGPNPRSGHGNGLFNNTVQKFVNSAAQQIGHDLVQDIMGGGGGGAGRGGVGWGTFGSPNFGAGVGRGSFGAPNFGGGVGRGNFGAPHFGGGVGRGSFGAPHFGGGVGRGSFGAPHFGGGVGRGSFGSPHFGGGVGRGSFGTPNFGGGVAPDSGGGVPNFDGCVAPDSSGGVPNFDGGVTPDYRGAIPNFGGCVAPDSSGGAPNFGADFSSNFDNGSYGGMDAGFAPFDGYGVVPDFSGGGGYDFGVDFSSSFDGTYGGMDGGFAGFNSNGGVFDFSGGGACDFGVDFSSSFDGGMNGGFAGF